MRKALLIIRDILIVALAVLVVLGTLEVLKARDHYVTGEMAAERAVTGEDVVVESNMVSMLFDGPGSDKVLVFYPTDQVEAKAYAPLLADLAANGLDCIVVKMPLYRPQLWGSAMNVIRAEYRYEQWYIGGHGLGAGEAGKYALKHKEDLAGLICLGGFADKNISMFSQPILLISGSVDGVFDHRNYEENAPYFAMETTITGGNFSQFGDFGLYEGDNEASIDEVTQRKQTVEAILQFVGQEQ